MYIFLFIIAKQTITKVRECCLHWMIKCKTYLLQVLLLLLLLLLLVVVLLSPCLLPTVLPPQPRTSRNLVLL